MMDKVIFDSAKFPAGEVIALACGYESLTEIVFTNEKIAVQIEAKTGTVEFFDLESNKLLSAKVETPSAGDEKFSEVKCSIECEQIALGFPQYDYVDNYPHCDGEHDCWTKITTGFTFLRYDYRNNCIVTEG